MQYSLTKLIIQYEYHNFIGSKLGRFRIRIGITFQGLYPTPVFIRMLDSDTFFSSRKSDSDPYAGKTRPELQPWLKLINPQGQDILRAGYYFIFTV